MGPRTVEITRGPNDALGVSIAGGKGSPLGDIPIFIAMIQASGVAARTQRLRVSAGVLNISCFISHVSFEASSTSMFATTDNLSQITLPPFI